MMGRGQGKGGWQGEVARGGGKEGGVASGGVRGQGGKGVAGGGVGGVAHTDLAIWSRIY